MSRQFKVFISSTTKDLSVHRQHVSGVISALGLVDVVMEKWPADHRPPVALIREALDESDAYLGIIGFRYGDLVEQGGLSFTEFEYERARERGLPRLMYLRHPQIAEDMELAPAIIHLRSRIEAAKSESFKYLRDEFELLRHVVGSLSRVIREHAAWRTLPEEERTLLELRRLTQEDFVVRSNLLEDQGQTNIDDDRQWFVAGMARSNVGRFYIQRDSVRREVAAWFLDGRTPFLFLTGESGIGKTNFLIELIDVIARDRRPLAQRAALMLPLGVYDPGRSFRDNLDEFLTHHQSEPAVDRLSARVVESLVHRGEILLILDGLDEFARVRSADESAYIFEVLEQHLDLKRSRVIVSCRDHVFRRLRGSGLFQKQHVYAVIRIPPLSKNDVETAIRNRVRVPKAVDEIAAAVLQQPLLEFAEHPLVLEMMCRFSRDSWIRLLESRSKSHLYDLWFEEIIESNADETSIQRKELIDDARTNVGRIATLMIRNRSDVVGESSLQANGIPLTSLRALTRQPFGILVRETDNEWGFVHASFREFALAKSIAAELASAHYELLAKSTELDYVGAEPQRFLRDLYESDQAALFGLLENALDSSVEGEAWSNIVWNVFETVGNIGEHPGADRFIERGLALLDPRARHGRARAVSYRAQQNIVRCLERLHESAPRPYCDYIIRRQWATEPDRENFGAEAVRGFHVQDARPGCFPYMSYRPPAMRDTCFKQQDVSHCLLLVLEDLSQGPPTREKTFVEINCTFALIRWLHSAHGERAKSLAPRVSPASRGNLFQAFLRLGKPDVLQDSSQSFEAMKVSWCKIDQSMLPNDFVFRGVRFEHCNRSWIRVQPRDLIDCEFTAP